LPDLANKSLIDQHFRFLQILHLAMLMSLAGYVALGLLLRPAKVAAGGGELSGLLVQIFYMISAGIVLAIFFLRRRLIRPLPPGATSGPEIGGWLAKTRTGHIIIYALCEAIGVFGLVSSFIAGSQAHFLNLIVLSLALMIFLRPKHTIS
jgi:cytochrome b561